MNRKIKNEQKISLRKCHPGWYKGRLGRKDIPSKVKHESVKQLATKLVNLSSTFGTTWLKREATSVLCIYDLTHTETRTCTHACTHRNAHSH